MSEIPKAQGQIKAIRRDDHGHIYVDIAITTETIGEIKITVNVTGTLPQAPEQARALLRQLGAEILHGFDLPGSLA